MKLPVTIDLVDQYLDNELAVAERARLEQLIAGSPEVAQLVTTLRSQRALRQATLATYEPSATEARSMAASALAALEDEALMPLAKIQSSRRFGIRGWGAVAAGVIIAAGSFWMGRLSTSVPAVVPVATASSTYSVDVHDADGNVIDHRQFATLDDVQKYIKQVNAFQAANADVQVADSSGSF